MILVGNEVRELNDELTLLPSDNALIAEDWSDICCNPLNIGDELKILTRKKEVTEFSPKGLLDTGCNTKGLLETSIKT